MGDTPKTTKTDIRRMKFKALESFAKENNIELGDAVTREEKIQVILDRYFSEQDDQNDTGLVLMVRTVNGAEQSADVHPDMVGEYASGGYREV